MNKKFLSLGLVVAISATTLIGCNKNTEENNSESITKEVTASIGTITEELSLSGSILANKSTSVTSTSKSTVEEIYIESGEEVSKGEDIILLENGTVIEAPYDGRISKISTSVNQDVDQSSSLFTIIDDSSFKIETSVGESEIFKISKGQNVDITLSASNKELKGVVSNVDAQATSSGNSTTFGVVITIDDDTDEETGEKSTNNFDNVYPGMSAEMNIIISESKDVVTIPIQAVSSRRGIRTVKVKDGENTKEVEVTIGSQDSSFVEIKSGLKAGDIVVYEEAPKGQSNKNGQFGGMSMPSGFSGGMPSGFGGGMPSGERPQMPSGGFPQMN